MGGVLGPQVTPAITKSVYQTVDTHLLSCAKLPYAWQEVRGCRDVTKKAELSLEVKYWRLCSERSEARLKVMVLILCFMVSLRSIWKVNESKHTCMRLYRVKRSLWRKKQ